MKNCCYQCEFRTIDCHSKCPKYKEFCDKQAKIRKQKMLDQDHRDMTMARDKRIKKFIKIKKYIKKKGE